MAGSYSHAVDDEGRLLRPQHFGLLIENLGDAYEMAEEMYGMIWWLAQQSTLGGPRYLIGWSPAEWVEHARQNYARGLAASPGTNGFLSGDT